MTAFQRPETTPSARSTGKPGSLLMIFIRRPLTKGFVDGNDHRRITFGRNLFEGSPMTDLFETQLLGGTVPLKNRIVMPPMTRTRTSEGELPNELIATYYGQRASAGLIITEAADVDQSSHGYARTPGIHSEAQMRGWRLVTDEVHRHGGTIFMQLWHVGRLAHFSILPNGQAPVGATEARAEGSEVFAHGPDGRLRFMPAELPRPLGTEEVSAMVDTFAKAAANARKVGF